MARAPRPRASRVSAHSIHNPARSTQTRRHPVFSVKPSVVYQMMSYGTKVKAVACDDTLQRDRPRSIWGGEAGYKAEGDMSRVLSDLQEQLADNVEAGEADFMKEVLGPDEVRRGICATNKSAAMDGQQTANAIGEMLLDLYERTGIRGFAAFSCGNPDDSSLPHIVDSDDCLNPFLKKAYKISSFDMLRNFEYHSCIMEDGKLSKNDPASVRSEIVRLQISGLRIMSKDRKAAMSYENYEYDIRELQSQQDLLAPHVEGGAHTALGGARRVGFEWKKARKVRVDKGTTRKGKGVVKSTEKGVGKGKARAAAAESNEDEESDKGSDKESDKESEEGNDEDEEDEHTVAPTSSAFAPTSCVPAAGAFAPASSTASIAGALTPASNPACNFDDFNFDVDLLPPMDLSNVDNAPALDYAFLNILGPVLPTNAIAAPTVATSNLTTAAPTIATAKFVPAAGASMGGAMGVFAVSTNTTPLKKRKGGNQGGSTKKKMKSTAGASAAPPAAGAASDVPAPKKRKARSNKGTKRAGSMLPPESQRKERSNKGKKRVLKAV
ncbi:hypothetical protein B0H17DRAFT_1144286 [Mycena rosella]|uniref:Uncharacterized protein n=1 Tax=Mycena rosella TaxID=1033263 RepID=A0AAD7G6X0_MYCRO|nr:hypothetical protein B0H17DRAFT_1144286 [Mycena rosella]